MKNKTRKITTILCAILLVVLVQAIGITYAKYFTAENATGGVEVAKWAFQIKKDGEETKTIKLVSTTADEALINGKLAPGTSGVIKLEVDATGAEVDLDYDVKFTNEKNKPNNLVFTYKGITYKSLSEISDINGKITYNDTTRTREITIGWKWAYETGKTEDVISSNDQIDTQNANTITEYTFDVVVTGTQSE